MKQLFSLGLFLFLAALLACSGSREAESPLPAPTIGQTETAASAPTRLATSAPEFLPKILQAPDKAKKPNQFPDAANRDLFRLTKELVPGSGDILRTLPGDAAQVQVGHTDTFWLVDVAGTESYQSEFTLVLVTPHAYWYVEDGLDVSLSRLERSASRFEESIDVAMNRFNVIGNSTGN